MAKSILNERIGYKEERYPMPHLLVVQVESFKNFLQETTPPKKRKEEGLQAVFLEIFPIEDIHGKYSLEFIEYRIGAPKYTVEEAKKKNLTYSAPLWVKLRLVKKEPDTGKVIDTTEQEVYLCDLPYMTPNGTFIINGVERVVVNQLHRSPGVYLEILRKIPAVFRALLVPYRGPWVDFSIDGSKVLGVTISKRRKIPITRLLKAFGITTIEEIFKTLLDPEVKKVSDLTPEDYIAAEDIVDMETGELIVEAIGDIDAAVIDYLKEKGIEEVPVYDRRDPRVEVLLTTHRQDRIKDNKQALFNIYRTLRYTPPRDEEEAREYIKNFFFSRSRFYLGRVGRYKLNWRLEVDVPEDEYTLTMQDIIAIVRKLLNLYVGEEHEDDVDDLANRRVRRVGELILEQFRIAFLRLARVVKERMLVDRDEHLTPKKLVNPRLVTSSILAFYTGERLSQFLDQTNPLSELTHKRRLSALGRGGLTKETADFEVRDVHPSHYGRLCPIETPEGQNIGLITSLTTYARIDELGFIRTPLLKVENGRVTKEVKWLAPYEEEDIMIASADTPVDPKTGKILAERVWVRFKGGYPLVSPEEVDYIDVSPRQVVSPSASLIPFLEHDDANRALMGSNMQRQSVPLLWTEPPFIGTGMERKVALDSGNVLLARRSGYVREVDSSRIVIEPIPEETNLENPFEESIDIYDLIKFRRSNQNTLINQRPIVKVGDFVKRNDPIADASATKKGELALGKNLLVAFLPWFGYNYEDAIIVSENLLKWDTFTSIHILEYEVAVRETKLGPEEITRDLPNVSDDALKHLDENGIVRIGAEVKPDDILVGKVSPKGERELSPEERLIQAIFGEKAKDVRDTSKRVPPGVQGVVVDVMVLSRRKDDPLSRKVMQERKKKIQEEAEIEKRIVNLKLREAARKLLRGEIARQPIKLGGKVILRAGETFTDEFFEDLDIMQVQFPDGFIDDEDKETAFQQLLMDVQRSLEHIDELTKRQIQQLERGDELPPGVLQLIKVYVAQKRKLQAGDKLSGRHGNKGVVAKIAPVEDMPFLDDGTPVDVVLNPLGVPSRMNVGQILETVLGWASVELRRKLKEMLDRGAKSTEIKKFLLEMYPDHQKSKIKRLRKEEVIELAKKLVDEGVYFATPVFQGFKVTDVEKELKLAGLPTTGKARLRDGLTGEYFDEEATVGNMYMMKLIHMVEDKIHARATGPYSLITQQPVGGKSHFGGQRFGEMEVWALEAYGAAYTLQEMLTVKSDDIKGRNLLYQAIIRGEEPPEPGMPASFDVLLKELQGLCLDIEIEKEE